MNLDLTFSSDLLNRLGYFLFDIEKLWEKRRCAEQCCSEKLEIVQLNYASYGY
jgi:hypothetical protein